MLNFVAVQPPARIRLRLNKNYQWTSTSSLFILVGIVLSRCCNNRVSIKDALKREKSKFQRGIGNANTLKDLGKTFHELNKLAESVVKGNFGALRKCPGQLLQDRLDDVLHFNEEWVAQRHRRTGNFLPGGAVNHLPKKISQVAQIFPKESKRNEGHIATT